MPSPVQIGSSKRPAAAVWAAVQWSAVVVVLFLALWLVLQPGTALKVFWYGVVPFLPAVFFVNPRLWRGLCPLATLNRLGNCFGKQRSLPSRTAPALNVTGIILFFLLVPARHFLFNHDGPVLAIAVIAMGALAVTLGGMFDVRSAFCNGLCPILPVELLYGVAPLAMLERRRCATCTMCTPRGCIDLAGRKTMAQRLGPARRAAHWITSPYGIFSAALPGFVFGYNQINDGPMSTARAVYAATIGWSLVSLAVVATLVLTVRLSSRRVLPFAAAAAGGIYYWYTGSAAAAQLAAPIWVTVGIRTAGIGVVAAWLARTFCGAEVV